MRRTLRAEGPATRDAIWAAYAHTSRWPTWAPHLRRVSPAADLAVGLRGQVRAMLGVRVEFEVTAVDEAAGTWSWSVRSGPLRMVLDHAVGEGWTTLALDGPGPVVLSYLPVARFALRRLVVA